MEKESFATTGQSVDATAVWSSWSHLPAVVKTIEDGIESGARGGLVRTRCLVCGALRPPREGSDEAFRALAGLSFGGANQGTGRDANGISKSEPRSNSPGVKGNFRAIMDENLSEKIFGGDGGEKVDEGDATKTKGRE